MNLIQNGFTKTSALKVMKLAGLSQAEMARILSLNTKTFARKKDTDRLNSPASDRLLKLAEVLSLGMKALNNPASLRNWLRRPLIPLDGKKPLDFMINYYGMEHIRQLLGRIEFGVYS